MGLRHPRACLRRNNDAGRVVGVISDADLMRREELGSEKTRPWWLKALTPCATLAKEFTKSHGKRVEELMSSQVISANEDASLGEIAALLAGGASDPAKMKEIMLRHGLVPVPQ